MLSGAVILASTIAVIPVAICNPYGLPFCIWVIAIFLSGLWQLFRYQTDDGPVSSDEYREPVSSDEYREPVSSDEYRGPVSSDEYREPVSSDEYREPVSSHEYREPVSSDSYRKRERCYGCWL